MEKVSNAHRCKVFFFFKFSDIHWKRSKISEMKLFYFYIFWFIHIFLPISESLHLNISAIFGIIQCIVCAFRTELLEDQLLCTNLACATVERFLADYSTSMRNRDRKFSSYDKQWTWHSTRYIPKHARMTVPLYTDKQINKLEQNQILNRKKPPHPMNIIESREKQFEWFFSVFYFGAQHTKCRWRKFPWISITDSSCKHEIRRV